MNLKTGVLLALAYYIPWVILTGGSFTPPNNPSAALVWFLYLIIAVPLLIVVAIVAWKFFDIDFIPWGLLIIIGSMVLDLALPIGLVDGLWIWPPLVAFFVGLLEG